MKTRKILANLSSVTSFSATVGNHLQDTEHHWLSLSRHNHRGWVWQVHNCTVLGSPTSGNENRLGKMVPFSTIPPRVLSSEQLRTVLAESPALKAVTFCDVDLPDAVALAQPDRHNAHEVSVHLLLRVLLPPHRQRGVAACRHQVLIEQPVLGHCKWQRWVCEGAAPLSSIL